MSEISKLDATRRFSPAPIWAGLAFAVAMGVCLRLTTGSAHAAFHGGFWSGVVFALVIAKIMNVSLKANAPTPDGKAEGFDADETIRHYGLANHKKGLEAVGGKLYLTDRRLRFRSHAFNFQPHDASYDLDDIASVEPARSLGIIPNRIVLHMKHGGKEAFVVSGRAEWVSAIQIALDEEPRAS
ncbi:MAG: hypothetical protein ACREJX_12055 [Polyangiaceae bacterium]